MSNNTFAPNVIQPFILTDAGVIAICFSIEAASDAFCNSPHMALCVAIPRCQIAYTLAQAAEFFGGRQK